MTPNNEISSSYYNLQIDGVSTNATIGECISACKESSKCFAVVKTDGKQCQFKRSFPYSAMKVTFGTDVLINHCLKE